MNRSPAVEAAVWVAVVLTAGASALAWHQGASIPIAVERPALAAPAPPPSHEPDAWKEAAALVIERNPFRVDRRPADAAFSLQPDKGTRTTRSAPEPPPSRPDLALAGVIGGPPWHAVLEGVPGQRTGRLVGPGDRLGDLRVLAVRHDTAIVAGFDTTWVLTLKRPWK